MIDIMTSFGERDNECNFIYSALRQIIVHIGRSDASKDVRIHSVHNYCINFQFTQKITVYFNTFKQVYSFCGFYTQNLFIFIRFEVIHLIINSRMLLRCLLTLCADLNSILKWIGEFYGILIEKTFARTARLIR